MKQKTDLKKLVRNALIHFAMVWSVLVFSFTARYAYDVALHGTGWQLNVDGTHTTVLQYFLLQATHHEYIVFFIAAFVIEACYKYLFKGLSFYWFAGVCILLGVAVFLSNLSRSARYYDLTNITDWIGPITLIAAYVLLYCLVRDYFYQRSYYKDLQLQHSNNQLNALKAQLNPHFLFNVLNYLYGTALKENALKTATGIDQLSDMMRYSLSGMQENFVPLSRELSFIQIYLLLQKERLPATNDIELSINIDDPQQELQIAPLILLPLIENAFKYGISLQQPCEVRLNISFEGNKLIMKVENTIIQDQAETTGNNIGIINTIKRLDLLYPKKYKYEQHTHNGFYNVLIKIDLDKVN
ncbi:sensor histidine kinase [Mucilaginibacter sp. KACC 22063]|uniref:sensor histidine kinase n=1 Tax=Mucilaginibacter sp. KACC 22063 TaxID=3025666 RepID=UPI0023658ADE|nr:histidine kinase [Mucilaginibacter sp. KACC 22063]WDF55289.1 histidine kinase [Mucilaginibacter sp. KACC 22063]